MSPEQLQGKEADARSDLFSFGCVLYEMLTGKRAFSGESAAAIIAAILDREPPPLDAPTPMKRVVDRCLAKDPDQRFQNALDLKTALNWASSEQVTTRNTSRHSRLWWMSVAHCSLLLAALGAWTARRSDAPALEEGILHLQIGPPEGGRFVFGVNAGGIAISPDGKTLAYVAAVHGKTALWVRPLDGADARTFAGTDAAERPFWSPDGKSIGFFAGRKLWRVDVEGGLPVPICDAPGFDRAGAWSSDGRILLSMVWQGLLQVPASGGTPTPLTTLNTALGETTHRWPQALPGNRFLYWAQGNTEEQSGIYASSLVEPAQRVRLTTSSGQGIYAAGHLLWMRGDTLVAPEFDIETLNLSGQPHPIASPISSRGITGQMNLTAAAGILLYYAGRSFSQLRWLDRAGKPRGLVGEPRDYNMFRLSSDGRRIAASILGEKFRASDLWLMDESGTRVNRLTFDPGANWWPIWSPDDRWMIFAAGDPMKLIRKEASGAGVEQPLNLSSNGQHPTDWSRDGRFILYYQVAADTQRDLWTLPVTPEGKPAGEPRVYLRTRFNELSGHFSPEAKPRWVAYTSDESGRSEVYVQAFPEAGSKGQISTGGGRSPVWCARGDELFYLTPDNKLMAVAVKLGADSVKAGVPHELFTLPVSEGTIGPYDVAPDGQSFLVATEPSQAAQPLSVIVNWLGVVKKRELRK